MVVCNVERFLAQAIESILGQTFTDFEFVIVDFGSTDGSMQIISSYADRDQRVKLHVVPSCGLAEARNASCQFAQGRYLAIMDADDVAVADRLALQVKFMEAHPEVSVLGGSVEWIDANNRALVRWSNPANDQEIQAALLERCPLWQPTVLMRREAFMNVGGYRGAFAPAEDYDLWLRIAERFRIANLGDVVLRYRIHPYQVSLRKRSQQILSVLAARISSSARKGGLPDPMKSVEQIDPQLLADLGVGNAELQNEFVSESKRWLHNMYSAGEYAASLQAALDTLGSDLEYVSRREIADLHLIVARIYWKEGKFLKSLAAFAHAAFLSPPLLARPLRRVMLQRNPA
jgi:glycosyltransferase involved in cell wall biosynthesis